MRVEGRVGETRVMEGNREAMVDDLRRVERNQRKRVSHEEGGRKYGGGGRRGPIRTEEGELMWIGVWEAKFPERATQSPSLLSPEETLLPPLLLCSSPLAFVHLPLPPSFLSSLLPHHPHTPSIFPLQSLHTLPHNRVLPLLIPPPSPSPLAFSLSPLSRG